jgi:hypothetical protein
MKKHMAFSFLTNPHHSHHFHKLISKPLLRARPTQVLLGIQDDPLKLARRNVLERALKVLPRHLGSAAVT